MVRTPVELVVWDWNGTLLDDTADCYAIANEMRLERGLPPLGSMEEYKALFGFPVIEYYRRMGYDFEAEAYEDVSAEFLRLYAARVAACPLQRGARETIAEIRRRGIRQVLLSATGEEKLLEQIAMFGLERSFDRVIGMKDNFSRGKAEEARAFFAEEGVDPARVLMIGDTDHDHAIAAALGCRCALLIPGHQTLERLRSLGAPLIRELTEALDML
ncbi:MAG: HAD hydrolase-like protein [Clostridia bacterium]|nr:HAD hydrolase-like protein [Clostridia bacterium]